MPHVVLENINSAKDAFDVLVLFTTKIEGGVLKITDKYLNASQTSVLVESLAIENGKNQSFFIHLSQKKTSLTVRLLPLTDPEKTLGVKTILALVARQIRDSNPNVIYGKNNLQDFLMG